MCHPVNFTVWNNKVLWEGIIISFFLLLCCHVVPTLKTQTAFLKDCQVSVKDQDKGELGRAVFLYCTLELPVWFQGRQIYFLLRSWAEDQWLWVAELAVGHLNNMHRSLSSIAPAEIKLQGKREGSVAFLCSQSYSSIFPYSHIYTPLRILPILLLLFPQPSTLPGSLSENWSCLKICHLPCSVVPALSSG